MKNKALLLVLIAALGVEVRALPLRISFPDTTIQLRSSIHVPVKADSSLSGLNISSFQFRISFSPTVLRFDSISIAGTMTSTAGLSVAVRSNGSGSIDIAAAGAADLSGTGVLFYACFSPISPGTSSMQFNGGTQYNYVNQGEFALALINGYVRVPAPPSIYITPASAVMLAGDSLAFTLNGGAIGPVTWKVADSSIGTISSAGVFRARQLGVTRIIAADSTGNSDTSGLIEVRPFRLSIADTTADPGDTLILPVRVSDLSGLDVTAGEITLGIPAASVSDLQLVTAGSLLSGAAPVFTRHTDTCRIAFGTATSVNGAGVLLYVKLVIASSARNFSVAVTKALFNQTLYPIVRSGFVTITIPGVLYPSYPAGIVAGDSVQFSVSGTAPYQWSTSDTAVAVIGNNGVLYAKRGGVVTVTVTDQQGAIGVCNNVSIYDCVIAVPDTAGLSGDTIDVPLFLAKMPVSASINAFQATVGFDTSLIIFADTVTASTKTMGWMITTKDEGNRIKIFAAGGSSVTGNGALCTIRFILRIGKSQSSRSYLNLSDCLLNEGTPSTLSENGSISFAGVSAPAAPVLLLPADNAQNQSLSPTFSWDSVRAAASYRLQVSTNTAFTAMVYDFAGIAAATRSVAGLLNGRVYYWRVNAANLIGTGPWSTVWSFTTIFGLPGTPTLIFPTDGATGVSINPTLVWNASTGATNYVLQVATDSAFVSIILSDSSLTSTSRAISSLVNSTAYYWRVRAKNAGGSSAWSPVRSFTTIIAAPATPALVSPADAASSQPVSLSLVWNPVSGTTSYHVQVATDTGFMSLFTQDSTLTDSLKAINGLANSTVYYWRARAKNAGGVSAWSGYRNFTTVIVASGTPTLVSPASMAADQPVSLQLVWNIVSSAISYHVQVATDAGFMSLFTQDSTLTDSLSLISGLANNTTYYWRVRAKNTGGVSVWSNYWSFTTIITAPATPALVSPADAASSQPLSLSLVWNPVSGTTSYHVQVATDTGFMSLFTQDSTLADSFKAINGLANSTVYYWRIRAKNAGGTSNWTSRWNFTTIITAPVAPMLVRPVNGDTAQPKTPTLKWSTVSGATSYHMQVATDTGFSNIFLQDSTLADTLKVIILDSNTTYYWRVRAKNAGVSGAWSVVWSFKTGTSAVLPYRPSLRHTFSITGSSGMVHYSLPLQCCVSLKYYDVRGRLIAALVNNVQGPGNYMLSVKNVLPSFGSYIRAFEAGNFVKCDLVTIVGR